MALTTLAEVGNRIAEIRAQMVACNSSFDDMRELDNLIEQREALIQARILSQVTSLRLANPLAA
jgi:hypothetical protein